MAWAFYDFANSAYALLITAVGFQIYFKKIVFATHGHFADMAWALAVGVSILASAVLSPTLGVAVDRFGLRKSFFVASTVLTITLTCTLSLVCEHDFILGIGLFVIANFFYNLSLLFYDSYLPVISTQENVGTISGFAWGLGYVGGIVCLILTYSLFSQEPSVGRTSAFRLGFVVVGLFYGVCSIPSIITLPCSPRSTDLQPLRASARTAFLESLSTVREWRAHIDVFRFILAFYFLTEAILTTVFFLANYCSTSFGLSAGQILLLTLLIQAVGFPSTWIAGAFADRWNLKRGLQLSVIIWILIVALLAIAQNVATLSVVCLLLGFVIGSSQALGRALLSTLVPQARTTEFFGFNSLSSKIAATLGPLIFGLVSTLSGSQRLAWLSLIPFLVLGLLLTGPVQKQGLSSHATRIQP